jgi:hypothetical protein
MSFLNENSYIDLPEVKDLELEVKDLELVYYQPD